MTRERALKHKHVIRKAGIRILLLVVSITLLVSPLSACDKIALTVPSSGNSTQNLAGSDPITLDPATAAETTSAMYIMQIFSGLVSFDENLNIVPEIAESWDVSTDELAYTFHLRHDVVFHNGTPVTAADFKYSWERALNPATGSQTAPVYLDDIVGADNILNGSTTTLSGVTAVDDYTLTVTITTPIAYFLSKLAYPTAFVVDKTNVAKGSTWWQKPNGTGPFKLKTWREDDVLILARNDNYYGEKAKVSQVNFELLAYDIQLYQEGSLDVVSIGTDYIGMATDPNNEISNELNVFQELSMFYIGFNAEAPPFDDVKIRQAFSYAVDKDRLMTLCTQDTVTTAYGILPPDMPGYNEDLTGLRYDPVKARQLIAESKYGSVNNLPPIVLTTGGMGGNIGGLLGGIIEEWRRNLGVEVTVRQLESENYLYYLTEEKDQLYDLGWSADYPDPQDFLDILFRTGVQNNIGGYSNPELDALLDEAAVEPNTGTRLEMYQQAEEIIVQDAAMLPLFFGRSYMLVKPYVKDYEHSPLGYPILKNVSIEK
jgi:oligopeptide transport system substrate-binding protein